MKFSRERKLVFFYLGIWFGLRWEVWMIPWWQLTPPRRRSSRRRTEQLSLLQIRWNKNSIFLFDFDVLNNLIDGFCFLMDFYDGFLIPLNLRSGFYCLITSLIILLIIVISEKKFGDLLLYYELYKADFFLIKKELFWCNFETL